MNPSEMESDSHPNSIVLCPAFTRLRLVQPWYFHFIDRVSNDEIFQLTMAANYLHIQPLLDLCFAKIASGIKGKTPEEIRANLGIEVDFSQEEEAKIRMENSWADSTT